MVAAVMDGPMPKTSAERLREARLRAGYPSMAEFARAVGVEEATYRMHENGVRGFTDAAKRYAAKLGVSYVWLLHGDIAFDDPEAAKALAPEKRVAVAGLAEAGQWAEIDTADQQEDEDRERVPVETLPDWPAEAQYGLRVRGDSVNEIVGDGGVVICVSIHAWPGGSDLATLDNRLVHVERIHPSGFVETTLKVVEAPRGKPARLVPRSRDPKWSQPVEMKGDGVEIAIRGVVVAKFERL